MWRTGLVLGCVVAVLAGCDRAEPGEAQESADRVGSPEMAASEGTAGEVVRDHAGTALPDMNLRDPAGEVLDLGAIEGPVLVNLWATWCAPCVTEMPMLDTLAGELAGDVRVVTVSQDLRGAQVVEPFFARRDFARLEPWLDPQAVLSERMGGDGQLPVSVLFDASGREVLRVTGAYEWDSEAAIALVREAVAE